MFSKTNQPDRDEMAIPSSAAHSSSFSVIGTDVTVSGDIDASVDLHIDGKIDGDIRCAILVQGENSTINGAVSADQARIAGTVTGAIHAKELIVEASARVEGDVTYEKLSIATGGHVEGSFRHMSSGTLKKDAPRSAAPADEPPLTLVNEAKGEQKAAF